MSDDKWCPICDHMWQLDYDFCPHCGTELQPASAREEEHDEEHDEEPEEEIEDSGVEH